LLELLKVRNEFTTQRLAIIDTVSTVFNIPENERKLITDFVVSDDPYTNENADLLILDDREVVTLDFVNTHHHIHAHGLHGNITIIKIQSVNLYFLQYAGQSEVFLNGLPLQSQTIYLLAPGSTLRLPRGTIYYSEIVNTFASKKEFVPLVFQCKNLEFTFPNGKVALHNINLQERSGTLVSIMGASGAGKTTLLNTLCGLEKPSKGEVLINGKSIFHNKKEVEGLVGYISQDDLLFEELSVYQNLYYNAQLCFKDKTPIQLDELVSQTLNSLGLYEIKNIIVGSPLNKKISGGQRKRLNIALELIREPAILFVDEPTSGLSSRDSENVMDLLKELTQRGKLIFVVIHQPSSDIYKMFDKLFLLDVGGLPIYYGNPVEGVMYFKKATNQLNSEVGECDSCGNVNPELVFNLIESKEIDEYGENTEHRKYQPKDWNELYLKNGDVNFETSNFSEIETQSSIPGKIKQWIVFIKRDVFSKISNKQYLFINLLEVPALALFLSLFIRHSDKNQVKSYSYFENTNIPAFYFMAIVVALLVGLTISAEEIFKDQKILKREKFLNLSRFSYLNSKILILFTISFVQSVLFCVVGFTVLKITDNFFPILLVIYSVFCSANLIGLILSSTFNSPVTIYIIIPLIIIPQMLLGGALFKFSTLNEFFGGSRTEVPALSNYAISRWAYEAIIVDAYKNNTFEKQFYALNKLESRLNYKVAYLLPKLEEFEEHIAQETTSEYERLKKQKLIDKTLEQETKTLKQSYNVTISEDLPEEKLLSEIKNQYSLILNELRNKKNEEIIQYRKTNNLSVEQLHAIEQTYTNETLSDIAQNRTEKHKVEYDSLSNSLIQVIDPVYRDVNSKSKIATINAHFFAANKYLLGTKLTTQQFNLIFIWFYNFVLFILLYFDVFKRLLTIKKLFKTT
jgi:ABC transport system ATP-binding/permease protein